MAKTLGFVKWTEDEIEILRNHGKNLSQYDLAKLIPKHNPIGIAIKCRRLGRYKTPEFKSKQSKHARNNVKKRYTVLNWGISFNDLSYETKQILIGSLLGDGFITKNASKSSEYCFREGHGPAQRDYLLWKANMLKELKPKLCKRELITPTHPIFTKLKKAFYTKGKRKNNLENIYTQELEWLGFLIWYLDDGGLQSRNREMHITSKLFDKEELLSLTKNINKKLDLDLVIRSYKHGEGIMTKIKVLAKDRLKVYNNFFNLFKKYNLPNCIYYKINIKFPKKIKDD
jgi:hypothetical protein